MGLFRRAVRSPWLLRKLLAELRLLRRATERVADAAELQLQQAPRTGGQAFRGLSHERQPQDGAGSSVDYCDDRDLAFMLQREEELMAILGRRPTEQELQTALEGRVE